MHAALRATYRSNFPVDLFALFDQWESWGRADSDFSWFWLGGKTANFTGTSNGLFYVVVLWGSLRVASLVLRHQLSICQFAFRDLLLSEYMAPIGQPIETLDQWPQCALNVGGRETSLRGLSLTGQPIKNYGPALHVWGRGGKFHPAFPWLVSHPIIFLYYVNGIVSGF